MEGLVYVVGAQYKLISLFCSDRFGGGDVGGCILCLLIRIPGGGKDGVKTANSHLCPQGQISHPLASGPGHSPPGRQQLAGAECGRGSGSAAGGGAERDAHPVCHVGQG